jgi:hypothetical protein
MLYACKVAQSNILPTDMNSTPYTETEPNIQKIETNIFTNDTNPPLSMKLRFPYNHYNASNTILDMFREYKNKSDSNFLLNYFCSILESSINMNYKILNIEIIKYVCISQQKTLKTFCPFFPESMKGLRSIISFGSSTENNTGSFDRENRKHGKLETGVSHLKESPD